MLFLATRAGWKVSKIYDHYTFKQARFKRDFVVINQSSRKIAKTKVEKEFYKLLNNSTFGNDCRNNICHCKLGLMFNGLDEISYIKEFTNIMQDSRYREFFSLDLLGQQVKTEYNQNREKLDQDNPFYFAILESYE